PASSWTQEPFQDGKIRTREDVRFLRSAPRHFHCKGILPRISTEWLADISVSRYRRDRRSGSATARTATGGGEIRRVLFGHGANPAVWPDGLTRHFCAGRPLRHRDSTVVAPHGVTGSRLAKYR